MPVPQPFVYLSDRHFRRHGPRGYADLRHFKPWLRDEFQFRCVYCLIRERWHPDGATDLIRSRFAGIVASSQVQ